MNASLGRPKRALARHLACRYASGHIHAATRVYTYVAQNVPFMVAEPPALAPAFALPLPTDGCVEPWTARLPDAVGVDSLEASPDIIDEAVDRPVDTPLAPDMTPAVPDAEPAPESAAGSRLELTFAFAAASRVVDGASIAVAAATPAAASVEAAVLAATSVVWEATAPVVATA